jgi:predicted ATPase
MIGRGFKGELAVRRGDTNGGVESLQECLEALHAAPYELLSTPLNIALVQGLAATGRSAEALVLVDETIESVEANGDFCYMPELLRLKGRLLLTAPHSGDVEAELCFRRSLELSRRQGARAWELRTAIDLAALLAARGQPERGQALLQPVYDQFGEGSNTVDLQAAERLLATLS